MGAVQFYIDKKRDEIRSLLKEYECQPILFIGSGIPRRYFDAPNWSELLKYVFANVPLKDGKGYEYHYQDNNGDLIEIGTKLSEVVFDWAWGDGRSKFSDDLFGEDSEKDFFIKKFICSHLDSITPLVDSISDKTTVSEISALRDVRPHAIITTNYDFFLENVFVGYEPITGQRILRYNTNSFGEIYHIHGDTSDFKSLVLTRRDYDEWNIKKKYISAKLLTYFAEHPVFIFGYNIGDPNVKSILKDIGEIVSEKDGLIPNVYQVVWHSAPIDGVMPDYEMINIDGREFRIKAIHTNELKWVFDALCNKSPLTSVNPKLVRALAARTLKLVRSDIPSGKVTVDYSALEKVANDYDCLPSLLGISVVDNPNLSHPLILTQVAEKLGFSNWKPADDLIKRVNREKGIDIKASDNRYHCRIKTGRSKNSASRKWSHETVDLLSKVKSDEPYEVNL